MITLYYLVFKIKFMVKLLVPERNEETGKQEANFRFNDLEVVFLSDVIGAFLDKRLGDPDDPVKVKRAEDIKSALHEAFKQLRPS